STGCIVPASPKLVSMKVPPFLAGAEVPAAAGAVPIAPGVTGPEAAVGGVDEVPDEQALTSNTAAVQKAIHRGIKASPSFHGRSGSRAAPPTRERAVGSAERYVPLL